MTAEQQQDTELTLAWVNGFRAARGEDALLALPDNIAPEAASAQSPAPYRGRTSTSDTARACRSTETS
jgi:hypothetical protein